MKETRTCWYLWFTTFIALLSYTPTGITIGWTSPILPVLQSKDSTIPTTIDDGSWMATIVPLVSLFSSPLAALSVNKLGLRISLLIPTCLYMTSWLIISLAKSASMLIFARSFNGIAMAFSYTATPIYLGEIAPNHLRSRIGLLMTAVYSLGIFWIYAIGELMDLWLSSLLSAVPIILFLIFYAILPESPYFLVRKKKFEESKKVLAKLRNCDPEEELIAIQISVYRIPFTDSIKELITTRHHWKALIICVGILVLSQITGGTAFVFYAHIIFENASTVSPYTLSLIKSLCQLLSCMFASYVVERTGKKPLLIISCIGSSVFTAAEGIYFYFHDNNVNVDSFWWVPLLSMVLFDMFQSIGIQPISIAYLGEFFDSNVKSVAVCLCKISLALAVFIVGFLFPYMIGYLGLSATFFIFSFMGIVGLVFVLVVVPETRGRSFHEIQYYLKHNSYNESQENLYTKN